MAKSQRFLFDTSFDLDVPDLEDEATEEAVETPEPEPPPTFTEEDMAAARAAARAEGEAAGRAEATASVERQAAEAMTVIGDRVGTLLEAQHGQDAELSGQAVEAALAMVRKLFPDLARRKGMAEIEAVIGECLGDLMDEPRIVIRVADPMLDMLKARIGEITGRLGFDGAVVLLAEPSLGPSDVKVEWADGGAERISEKLWAEMEAAAARLRSAKPRPVAGDAPKGDGRPGKLTLAS